MNKSVTPPAEPPACGVQAVAMEVGTCKLCGGNDGLFVTIGGRRLFDCNRCVATSNAGPPTPPPAETPPAKCYYPCGKVLGHDRIIEPCDEAQSPPPEVPAAPQTPLDELLALGTPWPLADVLERLAEAVMHGLSVHGCDAHGYELDVVAVNVARELAQTARRAAAPQTTGGERRSCNRHDDCDAADAKAEAAGRFRSDHCHDDCCDDCFGS